MEQRSTTNTDIIPPEQQSSTSENLIESVTRIYGRLSGKGLTKGLTKGGSEKLPTHDESFDETLKKT